MVESAAEALYGLIHARYIITARGLNAMADKFRKTEFGRCPRVYCNGQGCLPVGLSDVPGHSTVKLYCPKCEDIYYPRNKYHGNMDGAYFGTTFAHLFMMTFPGLRPVKPTDKYVPKAFGFRIHPSAWGSTADDNNNGGNAGGSSRRQAVGGGGGGGANGITAAAAAAVVNSIKRDHDEAGELQKKDKKGQSAKKM
jgi:casein kinase II subunit beta